MSSQPSEPVIKARTEFNPQALDEGLAHDEPRPPEARSQFDPQAFIDRDSEPTELEQQTLAAAFNSRADGKKRSALVIWVMGLLSLVVGVEAVLTLLASYQQSIWIFSLYLVTLCSVLLLACRGLWSELTKLRRLRHTQDWQQTGDRLRLSMQSGEATPFIANLSQGLGQNSGHLSPQISAMQQLALSQYFAKVTKDHNDAEQIQLFETEVLYTLDKKAQSIVSRYALEAATLLAASPLAMMDMAIVLWRNQKLLNDIAECYGIELGYWSRVRLLKTIVTNVIYAGTTEVVTDLGSQLLSMEMTGKLSARLAQGVGGGLLTARLGYQAMALCRPLAFSADKRPKLSRIHKDLLVELKQIFRAKMSASSVLEPVKNAEIGTQQPDSTTPHKSRSTTP
ncbi:YcjF family protein [Shewanella sp. NIFS-20-20]|uniref:YcjF family protein n=1 Tax=Shewanella sp. NIFS-20-20 TaxID=2853806 RepID=UPI001C467EF8|nr:TIGR01620 family protein [Shewanella sp. NIFS-20-20]MBV7315946.1 YcjF family protein [Shewanella sp. NIFS-20-20]